ncbi:MAG: hypothetical protein M1274_03750 [Actinobacteria bacterium]|nr:hypothetical protein [Actinomycetota bacterium]
MIDELGSSVGGNDGRLTVAGRVSQGTQPRVAALDFRPVENAAVMEGALNIAVGSGLLTAAQGNAIRNSLMAQAARMYVAAFALESYAPAGSYGVDVWLADATGAEVYRASTSFVYQSLSAFDLDFAVVDFGNVVAATSSHIVGDDRFVPGDRRPTIKNIGNVPLRLELRFTPMVDASGTVQVADLSASFLGEKLDSSPTGSVVFGNLLPPGRSAGIDFWLEPPADLPVSTYLGSVSVSLRAP